MKKQENAYYNYMNLRSYMTSLGIIYDEDYFRWVKDLMNTKVSMFDYENLPDGLTTEIVERALLFNNFLCFYKSPALNKLVLCRWLYNGRYDLYWHPTHVDLLSLTGQQIATNVPFEDIILVRDNKMDIIPFLTLNAWINKIIELEKTLNIIVKLIRFPTILSGDKEEVIQLKQLLKDNADCKGFIVGKKGWKEKLEQFDISIPCKPMELYELLDKYKDMALSSIGIYSVDEKRERIVTSEVEAQNDYVDFVYTGMVIERQSFIKQLNAKYGYDIKLVETYDVNKRAELKLKLEELKKQVEIETKGQVEIEQVKDKGGEDNGN